MIDERYLLCCHVIVTHFFFFLIIPCSSDICNFTPLGTRCSPEALCKMLHELFTACDEVSRVYSVYKVETIGALG